MNITEFLEARIAEDEAVARDRPIEAHIHQSGCYYYDYSLDSGWFCDCDEDGKATARVLAECAAKRAIIGEHEPVDYSGIGMESPNACARCGADLHMGDWDWIKDSFPCMTLRALASAHADHPDYLQEWAL